MTCSMYGKGGVTFLIIDHVEPFMHIYWRDLFLLHFFPVLCMLSPDVISYTRHVYSSKNSSLGTI